MGLAASQAKLLSITSRLSDNELRSQSITAAKMALANQTSAASEKYIKALGTNEFIYRTYDDNGNQVYTALTGAQLSTYAPLKNQYALVNTKGQVLVSELDAGNYEDSTDINEFLEKYGVERIDTGEVRTVVNPGYDEAYEEWLKEYREWVDLKPDKTDEKYWTEVPSTDSELYTKFRDASDSCYRTAISGSYGAGCYMHVLAHLLYLETNDDGTPVSSNYPMTVNTSVDGISLTFDKNEITGSAIYFNTQNGEHNKTKDMVEISQAVCDNYKGNVLYVTPNSQYVSEYDLTEADKNADPNDPEYIKKRLLSNYTFDENGDITLKTLKQKCADMAYLIKNYNSMGLDYNTVMLNLIYSFEEDMELAFTENIFDEDLYNEDYGYWESLEPDPLDVPATIDETIYKYSDKDKAQWYVNLWHRMNGESDEKDGVVTTSSTTTNVEVTSNSTTTTTTTNTYTRNRWDILEDGLMNNQDWLKYALESGTVSLERVNFSNPTEEGTGLQNATWTSIIYSNALDISEQTDDTAIAKAEAEYEQKTREIENKDKQYDSILKLLDTEHTALQTEYDSVKTVINKNTERTLKIYSA